MLYRVHIDMTKVLKVMKEANIKSHSKSETTVWVEAKDPDEACDLAVRKVCNDIIKERSTTRHKDIARMVRRKASVSKVWRTKSIE